MKGWLGDEQTPEEWIATAHGEAWVECHKHFGAQCAGVSIYRANVFKRPRYPEILLLEPNTELVFASPQEFIDYHRSGNVVSSEIEEYEKNEGEEAQNKPGKANVQAVKR